MLTHKITDTIKQRLLDHHNQLRRKVAKGEEPDQPAAANMRELVTIVREELKNENIKIQDKSQALYNQI